LVVISGSLKALEVVRLWQLWSATIGLAKWVGLFLDSKSWVDFFFYQRLYLNYGFSFYNGLFQIFLLHMSLLWQKVLRHAHGYFKWVFFCFLIIASVFLQFLKSPLVLEWLVLCILCAEHIGVAGYLKNLVLLWCSRVA
jgi:hypothetical protein